MIPIEPIEQPVEGNKEVVDLLESWLARARLGELNCVAVAGAVSPTIAFSDHAGVNTSHFAINATLDSLKRQMVAAAESSAVHVRAPIEYHIPADLVTYDICNEPTQFDFVPWITTAKMQMLREGLPGPLKIAFIEGPSNVKFSNQEIVSRSAWMEHVILPICRMAGAELDERAYRGRRPSCYAFVEIVEAAKGGDKVPFLKPGPGAQDYVTNFILSTFSKLPIVITLRESLYWPHRNSNLADWLKFAEYLQKQGEQVLFVRDTGKAREPLDGFATCPAASRDLEIRMALYNQAKCNFFIDNGPWHLVLVSSAQWIAFINVDPMSGYIPCTPQWWKRNHGVAPGQQFPWSNSMQRIVWAADTYDEMCKAWEDFRQQLAQAA